jgi:hypothetical protein
MLFFLPVPDSLVDSLCDYRKWQREYQVKQDMRTDLVVHNRSGEPLKPTTFGVAVKDAGDRVMLPA